MIATLQTQGNQERSCCSGNAAPNEKVIIAIPGQRYVGFTTDLKRRIAAHNAGDSVHTAKFRPWKLFGCHAFAEKRRAREFEHYLKSGSGKAFANKRFW